MASNWWDGMDLDLWLPGSKVLASTTRDMPYAQAIARHRATQRGIRQRIVVGVQHTGTKVLNVQDAPVLAAEPCS